MTASVKSMSARKPAARYALAVIAAGLVAFLYQPLVELYIFKSTDLNSQLTQWSDHKPLNSDKCTVHYEADACEDITIHWASSTAFIACGDPVQRALWYPPSLAYNASGRAEESFRENLFTYDIKKKQTTKLRIRGLQGDFVNHGIDVYDFPENPTKVHIFAVNHRRNGDSIVILSHVIGSDVADVVKEVVHPGIRNPNGVAAVGPLDFFITNDHYFPPGFLRTLEDRFGPWPWATDVQYCDAKEKEATCRLVSGRRPGFNGIAISHDKKRLFVGDCKVATLSVFNISESKTLSPVATINLGAAADNIRILPTTGDPIVSVFANVENLPEYLANVRGLGKDLLVPSAALVLRESRGYEPELIYWDDGSTLSYMTVANVDPYNHVFSGGSVLQYGGFATCDLPKDLSL